MATNRCTKCDEPLTGNPLHCPACGNTVGDPAPVHHQKKTRFGVGDTIDGRYEVVDILPSGGMGEVYKVRHQHLHDYRVIKILRADMSTGETGRKRFLREAKIAASISHPNLATLHDFSALPDGTFYMVSEFVDGVTIAEHIKSGGRFLTPHVLAIAEQVLDALAALHHRGIIHRDISPDNLMLTRTAEGRTAIKVIDLGIAKAIDSEALTTAGFFIGKARYASPEQLQCESEEKIDGRTDLYSLGIVLYEMVNGKDPYAGSTPAEYVIRKVTTPIEHVNPPAGLQIVPSEVEQFILKLLRVKRDERFSTADEALVELRSIMRHHPELTEETLSTITQSRELEQQVAGMSSQAVAPREETPAPEPKRPITEEIDMRDLVTPPSPEPPRSPLHLELEETPDYSAYAPAPPPEPVLSTPMMEATEVVPIAEIVNELKLEREAKLAREQRELDEAALPVQEPEIPPSAGLESLPSAVEAEPFEEVAPPSPQQPKVTASQQPTVVVSLSEAAAPFMSAAPAPAAAEKPVTASQAETYVVPMPTAPPPVTPPTMAEKRDDPNATIRTKSGEVVYQPLPTYVEAAGASGATTEVPLPRAAAAPVAPQAKKKGRAGVWITVAIIGLAFIVAAVILGSVAWSHFGSRILAKRAEIMQKKTPVVTPPPATTTPPPQVTQSVPMYTNTAVQAPPTDTAATATTATVTPVATETTATVQQAVETSTVAPKPPAKKVTKKKKEAVTPVYTQTTAPVEPVRPAVQEGEIVAPGAGVTDAVIRSKAPLRLPLRARLARARGAVRVSALVGIDGAVEQTKVIQSSGNDQVDRAAEAAAKASTFSPATKEGVRVRIWKVLEFQVGKQSTDAPGIP